MASEKDSGLEKADRSTSSDHGRRWARLLRTDSVTLLRKLRKAGVAIGGWDDWAVAVVAVVFEIGRIGGDVVDDMVVEFVCVCLLDLRIWELEE